LKKLSAITAGLVGQPMLKLLVEANDLEAAGRRILHFEVGDSDFDADPHVVDATITAIKAGCTKYVSSLGIPELRAAICEHIERVWGFRPEVEQVAVMPANSIIDFALRCLADPGDEVVFSDPGFPTYDAVANYLGLVKVRVPVREERGFRLDPGELRRAITGRTALAIINTPANPTGAVLTAEDAAGIARVAEEKDIYLLSDEIYYQNIYDGARHHSPAIYDRCRERTILLSGFSKGYSMSGWRLGYAVGPVAVIEKMGLLFNTVYTCLPPFIQRAGIAALATDASLVEARRSLYMHLRDFMVARLNTLPGVSCAMPQGAIYAFPNIKGTGMSSEEFSRFALHEAGVAAVPGSCFGPAGEGYVRFCYARREEIIEEACARLERALQARLG